MSAPKRTRLVRFVAAAELPFVLAIAPLLLLPTPGRLTVLAAVPVIWLCARITSGRLVPPTPVNTALWLLLAMVGVSLQATFNIRQSLGKVSGVILGALLFWAITRCVTTPGRLKTATAVFLAAGAALAVIGLLAAPDNFSAFSAPSLRRLILGLGGAEVHPNPVAGCLALFVPLQVGLLAAGAHRWWCPRSDSRAARRSIVILQIMLLCLTMGTFVLMRSRGAVIGLAVAALAFLAWHSRLTRIAAGMFGAGLVVATMVTSVPTLLDRQTFSKSGTTLLGSVAIRFGLWSKALEAIRDVPITGMGMNAFRKVMPVRYPLPPPPVFPDPDIAHAHNNFLQAALDLGIPGLVAYTSLWLVAAFLLALVYRRPRDRMYRTIAAGLGAGVIAHFTFGLADAIPLGSKLGVAFWITLALIVALHHVALVRPAEAESGHRGDWEA